MQNQPSKRCQSGVWGPWTTDGKWETNYLIVLTRLPFVIRGTRKLLMQSCNFFAILFVASVRRSPMDWQHTHRSVKMRWQAADRLTRQTSLRSRTFFRAWHYLQTFAALWNLLCNFSWFGMREANTGLNLLTLLVFTSMQWPTLY